MVKGLPQIDLQEQLCEGCVVGKQNRDSFPKESKWRAKKVLELVHTDICGPITPLSNGNKRYFNLVAKLGVYFLNAKSEAFSVFKEFKVLVEKDAGCLIRP